MGCAALSKGRGIDCSRSLGGVKTVYLVNFEDVYGLTVVDRLVTAFTIDEDPFVAKYGNI